MTKGFLYFFKTAVSLTLKVQPNMNFLRRAVLQASTQARYKRAEIFRQNFTLSANTKILDLGSETGSNINSILANSSVRAENVFIADISAAAVERGRELYGFNPILLDETGKLPFADDFFDIVYCSSVIEHVTISKAEVWQPFSDKDFALKSFARQREFAAEIRRVGKQYFVQTPDKYFPIESHSWLPFVNLLPRRVLIPLLQTTNKFWVKQTEPDFNLFNFAEMQAMFPDAKIVRERKFGLTKSLMAIKAG